MRVSILAADNIIQNDGKTYTSDCSQLITDGISAVQWHDDWGEVEYTTNLADNTRKPNERITDFAPFQSYVDKAAPLSYVFDNVIPPEVTI